jgi:hypothetical protein
VMTSLNGPLHRRFVRASTLHKKKTSVLTFLKHSEDSVTIVNQQFAGKLRRFEIIGEFLHQFNEPLNRWCNKSVHREPTRLNKPAIGQAITKVFSKRLEVIPCTQGKFCKNACIHTRKSCYFPPNLGMEQLTRKLGELFTVELSRRSLTP